MKSTIKIVTVLLVAGLFFGGMTLAAVAQDLKAQETCPIMGNPIDKASFVDVDGLRFYTCCPGCNDKIKADPAAAIAKLKELGEKPEPAPKAQEQEQEQEKKLKAQESCPFTGMPINKELFADVKGFRIYTCCTDCLEKTKKDPDAALAALKKMGEAPVALPVWDNDFEYVKKLSATNKKPILVNMTGSDWCIWCKRLKEEVFSKKEFKDYATAKLNLFYADFPRNKKLPEKEVAQNTALRDKVSKMKDAEGNPMFRGYPTIYLMNAKGEILAKTGYQAGGPVKYVAHLKELIAKAKK